MTDQPTPMPGIFAYDLPAVPRSLLSALHELHPCGVCGQPTNHLRRPLVAQGRRTDPHASCWRTMSDWDKQVEAIDDDPEYVAADTAADEARTRAEQIWEGRLRALGLPDWYVQRKLASRDWTAE